MYVCMYVRTVALPEVCCIRGTVIVIVINKLLIVVQIIML